MGYDSRVEFDPTCHMFKIHRPATSERAEVNYRVSKLEVIIMISDPKETLNEQLEDIFKKLHDESVYAILQPIRRRDAIEHTRSLGLS